ncbi:MAG: hypothetical protein AVDCRST_MAG93-9575, partial [uncultured Chloroflexia bacterium]
GRRRHHGLNLAKLPPGARSSAGRSLGPNRRHQAAPASSSCNVFTHVRREGSARIDVPMEQQCQGRL